ncbi:MAG: hypothetical protein QOF51_943 [Chloroflexota bacterium]|jgi:RNA polymerase-binding protein DksA|nr:hypothetical protein [Chloroflexota bacterium]
MTEHAAAVDLVLIEAALRAEQERLTATQRDLRAQERIRNGAQDEQTALARDEADVAGEDEQRALDAALLVQCDRALVEVERALAEIAAGTYGRCVDCGQPINPARLEARPVVQRCLSCQRQQELPSARGRGR